MGCQHPPPHLPPSSPARSERGEEGVTGRESVSERGLICCHGANCIVYVYFGYDTHLNVLPHPLLFLFPLLQFETGV